MRGGSAIPTIWIVSSIALWILVLFETGLLLLLLRALGELRQRGTFSPRGDMESPETWGLAIGEQAPSFLATDQDGKAVRLDDFQGQRRVLAFILPGCSSCTDTMKALNTFVRNEGDAPVLVIGGSDRELNQAYAVEHDAEMSILTPALGFDGERFRIRGVPFIFVLDEAGVIRAKGAVYGIEQLQELLTKAFALAPTSR